MDFDQLKQNRRIQNAKLAKAEVKRQRGDPGDGTAFISGIENGQWIAEDRQGNIYKRAIPHTNRGLGIGLTVDLTRSVGRSKVDAGQIEAPGVQPSQVHVISGFAATVDPFPWIGLADTEVDLYASQAVSANGSGECFADKFLFHNYIFPTAEVPTEQPYYVSCLDAGAITITSVLGTVDGVATVVRQESLPGATYIGGTAFYANTNVISAFENAGAGAYPDLEPSEDPSFNAIAVPVGGQCYALSEQNSGSDTLTASGFETALDLYDSTTVISGPGQGQFTDRHFRFGYNTSENIVTTYSNFADDIKPIIAGQNLAIYLRKKQPGTRVINSNVDSANLIDNPNTHIDFTINNPSGPPTINTFTNNRFDFTMASDNNFDGYDSDGIIDFDFPVVANEVTVPSGRFNNLAASNTTTTETKYLDPTQSFAELYLVASDDANYSAPYLLDQRTARVYEVSINSGFLSGEQITLEILTGGYSGPEFETALTKTGTTSNANNIGIAPGFTYDWDDANSIQSVASNVIGLSTNHDSGLTFPGDYNDYVDETDSNDGTNRAFHRSSGTVVDGGNLKEVIGLGAFNLVQNTIPGNAIAVYEYEFDRRFTDADFAGGWILVAQSTGQRYHLTHTGSTFGFTPATPDPGSESTATTRNINGTVHTFDIEITTDIKWDAIAGDIEDMEPGALVLYPEGTELAFSPEFSQLLPNNAEFTRTTSDGGGGGGQPA